MFIAGATGNKFVITRSGIVSQSPGYSMPRDTQSSMLALVEKRSKATPGPDEHYQEPSWKAVSSNFGVGTKGRKTFCDEA